MTCQSVAITKGPNLVRESDETILDTTIVTTSGILRGITSYTSDDMGKGLIMVGSVRRCDVDALLW